MTYTFNIISWDQIPDNIFICDIKPTKDREKIYYFHFENGLKCFVNRIVSAKDAIEIIFNAMKDVLDNDTPQELQNYYYNNFDDIIPYNDCIKIYNYYNENKKLIEEVYNSYFDNDMDTDNESVYSYSSVSSVSSVFTAGMYCH